MPSRRDFLRQAGAPTALALCASPAAAATARRACDALRTIGGTGLPTPAGGAPDDEALWREVQQAYTVDRSIVNLDNGGVNPSPAVVQRAMQAHLAYSNGAPVYTLGQVLGPQRESVRAQLARAFGCDAEEVALTRNTTEGMETCQLGLTLRAGDEVLTTTQDYWRFLNTWKQRERRDGIVLRQIRLPVPAEDPRQVVALFEQAMTPRTRAVLVSHVINLTGQILPVREIVRMARARGVPVLVDGAHSFAQFAVTRDALECDYYATSLHKWLGAPHGTGMLYVRRDRIAGLWPMMPAPEALREDVRKFESVGTVPVANHLAVSEALAFYQGIGAAHKEARLRYLRDRWERRLRGRDRVRFHTSAKPEFACTLCTVQVEGVDSVALAAHLWRRERILVKAIKHPEFEGIRVTPNVYTTADEVDRFGDAMEAVLRSGVGRAAG